MSRRSFGVTAQSTVTILSQRDTAIGDTATTVTINTCIA
jgi:hypothetical protein